MPGQTFPMIVMPSIIVLLCFSKIKIDNVISIKTAIKFLGTEIKSQFWDESTPVF